MGQGFGELSLESLNRHHLHHHGGVLGEDLGQRLLQVGGPGREMRERASRQEHNTITVLVIQLCKASSLHQTVSVAYHSLGGKMVARTKAVVERNNSTLNTQSEEKVRLQSRCPEAAECTLHASHQDHKWKGSNLSMSTFPPVSSIEIGFCGRGVLAT